MAPVRIAEGVYRLGSSLINWYLVEDGGRFTVVDAGLPGYRSQLDDALAELGGSVGDVEAIVLTHAHVDHVGFAESLRAETGVPVLVHPGDEKMARTTKTPMGERGPLPYLWRPQVWQLLLHGALNGGVKQHGITELRTFEDGEELDVPGRPHVVHTPGHTRGSCSLHLPDRSALLVGDALCTRNPMTGREGPQIMPASFTVDVAGALAALERIEAVDADVMGFGHGDPWTGGTAAAVTRARELGPS